MTRWSWNTAVHEAINRRGHVEIEARMLGKWNREFITGFHREHHSASDVTTFKYHDIVYTSGVRERRILERDDELSEEVVFERKQKIYKKDFPISTLSTIRTAIALEEPLNHEDTNDTITKERFKRVYRRDIGSFRFELSYVDPDLDEPPVREWSTSHPEFEVEYLGDPRDALDRKFEHQLKTALEEMLLPLE